MSNDEPLISYSAPSHIPAAAAVRHVWGDDESGQVADLTYVSTAAITQLMFSLGPGEAFHHSEAYKTVFAADEVYYVLQGTLILNNPETGEVHRLAPGDAAFFRRDTWHHGYNHSTGQLRVLEYFAPPPAQRTGAAYARTKPNLTSARHSQDQWLGRWPMAQDEARQGFTIRLLPEASTLWRLEGRAQQLLVGLLVSTEHLTVGKLYLPPGQHSDLERHAGDEALYLLEGRLHVRAPESDGLRWFEIKPGDGFFVPQGIPHQYCNLSDQPVQLVFGVAPSYSTVNA